MLWVIKGGEQYVIIDHAGNPSSSPVQPLEKQIKQAINAAPQSFVLVSTIGTITSLHFSAYILGLL